jgi:hypothetical protein
VHVLEIELDIFSGIPNPTWMITGSQEKTLMQLLRADPLQATSMTAGTKDLGLGYRGLIVRRTKPDAGASKITKLHPAISRRDEFRVGVGPAKRDSAAEWLLKTGRQAARLANDVQEAVERGVARVPKLRGPVEPASRIDRTKVERAEIPVEVPLRPGTEPHETWWACGSNYFSANADFFNEAAHVGLNNCYCFASNYRPDIRYALPGRRGGRPATSITCDGVIAGLRADGWQDGCQPNGLTIALVIWPNVDYHFYRLVTGGPYWWWGHKPGGTPARYTDDCGHPIYQYQGRGYAPNNICRGNYSNFCGYFYQDNWTAFVA